MRALREVRAHLRAVRLAGGPPAAWTFPHTLTVRDVAHAPSGRALPSVSPTKHTSAVLEPPMTGPWWGRSRSRAAASPLAVRHRLGDPRGLPSRLRRVDHRDACRLLRRRTLGLAGLAIVARVGYWLATLDYSPVSDARSFHVIARSITKGNGFADVFPELSLHATAFRAPLFPSLLAAPYRVFGTSIGVGRVAGVVLGVVLVLLVERFVTRIGGPTAGLIAAVAVAVYPPLVANDVAILGETLSLILIIVVGTAVIDDRWVVAGITTGLLVLARNSAQLYALMVAALLLRRVGWKRTLAFLAVAFLVVTPWLVRNAIQVGAPVPTTSNGFNLAALYSVEAHDDDDFVDPVFDERFADLRFAQFDELDWDEELRSRGFEGLRAHPLEPLRVARRNLLRHFELKPWENDDAEEIDGRDLTIRHVTLPLFYVVTVAGVAGLWVWRRNRATVFLALTAAYFSLVSIFSVFAPRLRGPFDLVCCIGVGLLVAHLRRPNGAAPPASSTPARPGGRTP